MFAGISLNPNKKNGKRINEKSLESKKTKHKLGRPEWQQDCKSCQHAEFPQKDVTLFFIIFL